MNRRTALMASLAACLGSRLPQARAQGGAYPSRPIKIVVAFGPGGSGDITARMFGRYLEEAWRTNVVVENRPGANGLIGTEFVRNATPDGYTLEIASGSTHAAAPYLFKKLPYDPLADFEHIGLFGVLGSAALVPAGSPFKSIPELVAFSRANPGKLFFAHYNTSSQVPAEMFKAVAQLPIDGVAYKSVGHAVSDVLGGQAQLIFMDYVAAAAHISSGAMRPIGVTEPKRAASLPAVPAIAEFYPGYQVMAFLALAAPARTPRAIVLQLNQAMRTALATSALRDKLQGLGLTLRDDTPEQYRAFLEQEIANWANYVKVARIEPQ